MQKQFEKHVYGKIKTETHDKVTCFYFGMLIEFFYG